MLNDEFKADVLSKMGKKKHDVTKLLSRELRARSVWGTFSSSAGESTMNLIFTSLREKTILATTI